MCKVLRIVLDIQQVSWKCKVFGMMMMGLDFKFVSLYYILLALRGGIMSE